MLNTDTIDMKTTLSKIHNFIQQEFNPVSKEYFDKRFYSIYKSITFDKEKALDWNNKIEIEISSLLNEFSFIKDIITYRKKISDLEEYCNISYKIITEHFKTLKKVNTLYTDGLFESKQVTFANNIVRDKRRDFYYDIFRIFFNIEKLYSIELNKLQKENNKNSKTVKSEYNLVAVKYQILDKYKKIPFRFSSIQDRNKKIIEREKDTYKTVINDGSLKTSYNKITNFEFFLTQNKNQIYVDTLLIDEDIKEVKEAIKLLNKFKKE